MYRAVAADEPHLDRLCKEMPAGWRPGQPIREERLVERQLEDVGRASLPPVREGAAEEPDHGAEQGDEVQGAEEQPAKRVCRRLPPEAKDFALQYVT